MGRCLWSVPEEDIDDGEALRLRLAGALEEFDAVIRKLRIPAVTAWTHDLIASDDELFCGRPGTIGERAGNFTVQNSDVLLVLGSRLNIRQTSYNWASFARFTTKIQVDVDAAEFTKPLHHPDVAIHCDVKVFLQEMLRQLNEPTHRDKAAMNGAPDVCACMKHQAWLERAREWKTKGTAGLFDEIVTKDSRTPMYQDKQGMMLYLLQKWEIAPEKCLMIGDTMEDAEAASRTGMRFCLVTHGYGAVPEGSTVPVAFRIDRFSELVSSLAQE